MLDFGHFPVPQTAQQQIFTGTSPTNGVTSAFVVYTKPLGCAMGFIFLLGGGGGGGGGFSAAASSARGGGGGGGSSGLSTWVGPLSLLPDRLPVSVGQAGNGVASGTANGGTATSVYFGTIGQGANDKLLQAFGGGAGTSGTGAAVGAAGAGGSASSASSSSYALIGVMQANAGNIGALGGAVTGAVGVNVNLGTGSPPVTGGAGGAGVTAFDFAGGTYSNLSSYIAEQASVANASGSVDGVGGNQIWKPFFSFGGGGGSSSNAGVGGRGGTGAYGAGGGGGGGGTTGGTGGDGGPGIAIFFAW